MKPENTLCLIVDIQERLQSALSGHAHMSAHCRLLLQGLAALGIPFIATEQYPKGLGRTIAAVSLLLDGAPVYEKTSFSAFLPEIHEYIVRRGITDVILIGAETHICILQTAADLRAEGLNVYVPYDCTASRHPDHKTNGLEQMRDLRVTISNTESILFRLLGDAAHPAFKTVSKLIQSAEN